MTAHRRSRTFLVGAAVAALLAPLAIVLGLTTSASAAVGPRPHEVYMYKVEKQVDLSGEWPDNYLHDHLYCNPGDIALDGMWRVDHVDQVNPDADNFYGDERDVVVYASYGDDIDRSKWHFRMENYADGNAQVKLFLTCIRGTVEQAFGHTHDVLITNRIDFSHGSMPAGPQEWDHNNPCPVGYWAVAPGFNAPNDDYVKIFRSYPTSSFRGWHWAFLVDHAHTDINVYVRCLNEKVRTYGSHPSWHSHKLQIDWVPNFGGHPFNLSVSHDKSEKQLSCDTYNPKYHDYKAMVGGFYIDDPHHVWFLGMDPRPKTRAYSFYWDGSGSSHGYLGVLCIRARTSQQIRP